MPSLRPAPNHHQRAPRSLAIATGARERRRQLRRPRRGALASLSLVGGESTSPPSTTRTLLSTPRCAASPTSPPLTHLHTPPPPPSLSPPPPARARAPTCLRAFRPAHSWPTRSRKRQRRRRLPRRRPRRRRTPPRLRPAPTSRLSWTARWVQSSVPRHVKKRRLCLFTACAWGNRHTHNRPRPFPLPNAPFLLTRTILPRAAQSSGALPLAA